MQEGENGFTFGMLYPQEQQAAADARREMTELLDQRSATVTHTSTETLPRIKRTVRRLPSAPSQSIWRQADGPVRLRPHRSAVPHPM